MTIDKQCFTKIVKSDFEVIGKYIVLPIIIFGVMIFVYNSANIDFNFIQMIIKSILENKIVIGLIVLDTGVLTLIKLCINELDLSGNGIVLYLFACTFVIIGLSISIVFMIHNFTEAIIPNIINTILLLITIPLIHGYIKCKKV